MGLADANSSEFNEFLSSPTEHPVIDIMPEQKDISDKGGTMRLGLYPCVLKEDSISRKNYDQEIIYERHRHRYEFNNEYRSAFESAGMSLAGISPDSKLVEIVEIPNHKWYVGVQFHPEFKSRPNRPHPLFVDFVKHTLKD